MTLKKAIRESKSIEGLIIIGSEPWNVKLSRATANEIADSIIGLEELQQR